MDQQDRSRIVQGRNGSELLDHSLTSFPAWNQLTRTTPFQFVRHQVDLRREKPSDRQDILGRLMSPRDPDTGELLNPNSVESEAFVFL